jgi:hypothetical protein
MSDEAKSVNLEDLSMYLVIGIDRETGQSIMAASQGMTLPDMGMLLGRANVDLDMHVAAAGSLDAARHAQAGQSQILRPR